MKGRIISASIADRHFCIGWVCADSQWTVTASCGGQADLPRVLLLLEFHLMPRVLGHEVYGSCCSLSYHPCHLACASTTALMSGRCHSSAALWLTFAVHAIFSFHGLLAADWELFRVFMSGCKCSGCAGSILCGHIPSQA